MSMPRCWPASYSVGAVTKGASTAPDAGQLHARADGEVRSATRTVPAMAIIVVVKRENMAGNLAGASAVVKFAYREPL
jgi:hypothetical protein